MRVLLFNTQDIFSHDLKWGFEQLGWKALISRQVKKEEINKEIELYRPDLVMTFGSPMYYKKQPEILEYLGNRTQKPGYKYIHWDTDGILSAQEYQLPMILTGKPDQVFTPCREALKLYKSKNIKADIMRYGINPSILYKAKFNGAYQNMITYVANFYKAVIDNNKYCKHQAIEVLVGGLIKNDIPIHIWGNVRMKNLYKYWVEDAAIMPYHGSCRYQELNEIYSNSYMNIATQNGLYHISKRTYDILGASGLALCYYIPGLEEEFECGKDLVAVSSTEEALYYINHYKKYTAEYEAIKINGYKKVINNYTYKHRLQDMLKRIGL